jgi:hypothetical protein
VDWIGGEPEVLYARARLTSDRKEASELLGQALDAHLAALRDRPRDYNYIISLRPDFVIDMCQLYFIITEHKLPPIGYALSSPQSSM